MEREPSPPEFIGRVARECIAVRVRLINRVITALYDEALRPHGLRVSQANILVAVAHLALDPGRQLLSDLVSQLDHALPPPHMLAAAPAAALQALLVAVPPPLMRACLRRLVLRLRDRGYGARLGIAWFPADGRTPLSLQTLAQRRARADAPDPWLGLTR